MTADRRRRRRAVWGAAAGVAVGMTAVVGIGNAGRVAILNTTDGDLQGQVLPEDRFPQTDITALAIADETGGLASLALLVGAPDGEPGGTIVVVPVNADTTNGYGDERRPLDEGFAAAGADEAGEWLSDELPLMLGISVDETVVLDGAQLAADVGALDGAVAIVDTLATRPDAPVLAAFPAQVDAWRALADSASTDEPSEKSWAALLGGAAEVAALSPQLPAETVLLDGRDVSFLDRAEIVTLFAHIAPARVAAPNAGLNFRVVSSFADEQLDGATRYGLAALATERLLAAEHNVLSVDTAPGTATAATIVEVDDEALLDGAAALARIFGPVEVRLAERRVAGVDIVVTLGTDFPPTTEETSDG